LNKTKILFICGSVEPGKDGVGDYTRRLCGELIRTGHQATILSLCDKEVIQFTEEIQIIEETEVKVNRIPRQSTYEQRLSYAQAFIKKESPSCISLQYVPHSFHPKGLPFWLPTFLKQLKGGHQWHVMFHEMWLAIEKKASIKDKLIGALQKKILKKSLKGLKCPVIHTQSKIYQNCLYTIGITADYLPLFGNISVKKGKQKRVDTAIVFVVFAGIHEEAPFEDFIKDLSQTKNVSKFKFIGRNGARLSIWTHILDKYKINYEVIGEASPEKISTILTNADYGISSTPYKLSDKSGVVAAMREHQLPIITVARPWVDVENFTVVFKDIEYYQKGKIALNKHIMLEKNMLQDVCSVFFNSILKKE